MNGRRRILGAVALMLFASCVATGPSADERADIVLVNGKILTVDDASSVKQAIAIRGERIAAVGTDADVRRLAGTSTRVIDLGGRTVIPGLIDSHVHAIRAGLTYDAELHWDRLASLKTGLDEIAARARTAAPGGWIRVLGGWHETQFPEKRLPTAAELDQVAPSTPVWVQRLSTQVVLNAAAVKALGIGPETPNPPGGTILKDASGKVVGLGSVGGINFYYPNVPRLSPDEQIESTRHWFTELNRSGLTGVIDAGGGLQRWPGDYAAVNALHDRGALTLRVRWFLQPQRSGKELEDVSEFVSVMKAAPKTAAGDDMMRALGIGEAPVSATNDGTQWGLDSPTFPTQAIAQLDAVLRAAVEGGWSFSIHSARNKSLEQLLPTVETLNASAALKDRHISFAHIEDITPASIARLKALGAGVLIQDRLVFSGDDILKNWTPDMVRRAPPVKSLLKAGVPVGGGTDATQVAPYPPFRSLWWLVTGKTIDGRTVRGPDELVTREEALRVYTIGSAWFSADEKRLGSLEVGKLADLVVLSKDYLTVPEDEIPSIESLLTVVGGKAVYSAGPFR
jgi:predicted amidohydrolase YtcJ